MSERPNEFVSSSTIDLISSVTAFSHDAGFLDSIDFDRDPEGMISNIEACLQVAMSRREPFGAIPIAISLLSAFELPTSPYDQNAIGFLCRTINCLNEGGILTAQNLFISLKNLAEQRKRSRM